MRTVRRQMPRRLTCYGRTILRQCSTFRVESLTCFHGCSVAILDAAFLIGVLACFLKGSDLILRPHQQKWVHDKAESLTLWLADYQGPLRWCQNVPSYETLLTGAIFVTGMLFIGYCDYLHPLIRPLVQRQPLGAPLAALVAIFAMKKAHDFGSLMIADMAGKNDAAKDGTLTIKMFGMRSAKAIAITGGFVALFFVGNYALLTALLNEDLSFDEDHALIAALASWPIASEFLTITGLAAVVALMVASMALLHVAVLICRAVCWRLVEHKHGAWSAIVLVLTIILGIAEVYLRAIKAAK